MSKPQGQVVHMFNYKKGKEKALPTLKHEAEKVYGGKLSAAQPLSAIIMQLNDLGDMLYEGRNWNKKQAAAFQHEMAALKNLAALIKTAPTQKLSKQEYDRVQDGFEISAWAYKINHPHSARKDEFLHRQKELHESLSEHDLLPVSQSMDHILYLEDILFTAHANAPFRVLKAANEPPQETRPEGQNTFPKPENG